MIFKCCAHRNRQKGKKELKLNITFEGTTCGILTFLLKRNDDLFYIFLLVLLKNTVKRENMAHYKF